MSLLPENQYFTLIETRVIDGIEYEVYNDDYGQSFHIAYKNPKTGTVEELGCGTYCDFKDTLDWLVERNK